jgi:hypothetical protein
LKAEGNTNDSKTLEVLKETENIKTKTKGYFLNLKVYLFNFFLHLGTVEKDNEDVVMEELDEKPARIIKTGKRKLRVESSSDENDETNAKSSKIKGFNFKKIVLLIQLLQLRKVRKRNRPKKKLKKSRRRKKAKRKTRPRKKLKRQSLQRKKLRRKSLQRK